MDDIEVDRARAAWWLLGCSIAAALSYVLFSFVGTIVFGLFVYYAARPLNWQLQRVVPSRTLAAMLSLLAISVPTVFLLGYTLAVALGDLQSFLVETDAGAVETVVNPWLAETSSLPGSAATLSSLDTDALQGLLTTTLEYVGFVGNGLLHVFIMFVLAFYLLRDDRRLGAWLYRRFGDEGGNLTAYLAAVDRDLHNIFFGNLLNILLTGTIGAVTFTLLNTVAPAGVTIPHPALLGLLTGVASLVPIVGMKIVILPVGGLLFSRAYLADVSGGFGFAVLFLVVSIVVVDVVPDLVLRPYVSARELHTGLVMVAYLFGPLMFGWYGLFLGPLLLVVVVQFVDQVLPDLMAGRPIETASTQASITGQVAAESSPLFAAVDWDEATAGDTPDGTTGGDQQATPD
jgi:predicted PurR-regulated permease PerM